MVEIIKQIIRWTIEVIKEGKPQDYHEAVALLLFIVESAYLMKEQSMHSP